MRITDLNIREVLTTNSQKTIEVEVKTKKGIEYSSVPVNENGIYKVRYLPSEEAIKRFLEIKRHFVNNTFDNIEEVDSFLRKIDVSIDFREIGGNLAFAISSALLKAFANWEGTEVYEYLSKGKSEIPLPLVVVTDKEKNQTDLQEFLLYPVGQKIFTKVVIKLLGVYKEVNQALEKDNNLTIQKILKTLSKVTTENALEIGIDFEATNVWNNRKYVYSTGENMNGQEQLLFVQDLLSTYPIGYIEDPFHEEDFVLFSVLTRRLPTRLVVGDDLYANNFERLRRGIEIKATSGINVTPDQMGTISDFIKLVKEAKKNKISTTISCVNTTTDNLVAHLAVGLQCDYVKLGFEGVAIDKVNELIRIEEKL